LIRNESPEAACFAWPRRFGTGLRRAGFWSQGCYAGAGWAGVWLAPDDPPAWWPYPVDGADRPSAVPERSAVALSPVMLRNRACCKGRRAPRRLARVRVPGAAGRVRAGGRLGRGGRCCRGYALRGTAGGWLRSRGGGRHGRSACGPAGGWRSVVTVKPGRDSAPLSASRTYGYQLPFPTAYAGLALVRATGRWLWSPRYSLRATCPGARLRHLSQPIDDMASVRRRSIRSC